MDIPAGGVDPHKPTARLDEPPAEERALPDLRQAILLAKLLRLVLNAERGPGLRGGDQIVGLAVIRGHRRRAAGKWQRPPVGFEPLEQIAAPGEPGLRETGQPTEILDLEVGLARIGLDHERRMLGPVKPRATGRHRMGEIDVGGHRAGRAALAGHDRAQ